MTLPFRLSRPSTALALSTLLLVAGTATAAERVRVAVPWTSGQTVAYDDEAVHRENGEGDGASVRRITDETRIRVDAAGRDGYALTWTTHGSRVETVDGDRSLSDLLAPVLDALDEVPVTIELDGDGRYRRVRDLDALVDRVRKAMLPAFLGNLDRSLGVDASGNSKVDKGERDALLAAARRDLESNMDSIVSRDSVEAGTVSQMRQLSAFVGKTLVAGKDYRDAEPILSPVEGRPLPGVRDYTLEIDRDDPGLARLRWTHRFDAKADAKTQWTLAQELGARTVTDGLPQDMVLTQTGTLVFRRDTGVVELLEVEERSKLGSVHDEEQRHRMRLRGSARTWAQEEAARRR
ncbi:MAG: hypothetical protein ACTHOH_14660 [Lysobacteraceae bacterium]